MGRIQFKALWIVLAYMVLSAKGQIEVLNSEDYLYILGSAVRFVRTCRFRNGNVDSWRWLRNSTVITSGITSTNNMSRLSLSPTEDSGGHYICEALDNEMRVLGSASVGNLIIRSIEQVLIVKPIQHVVHGGNILLRCSSPLNNAVIYWRKGSGQLLQSNVYAITNASDEDHGSYSCFLIDGVTGSNFAQRSIQLFVHSGVKAVSSSSDVLYIVGYNTEMFVRECQFRNGYAHSWRWLRNTDIITSGITSTHESSRLSIIVTEGSGGQYTCEALDDNMVILGMASAGNLTLKSIEQVVSVKPFQYVLRGGNILLKCTSPLENVRLYWRKGSDEFISGNVYNITNAGDTDHDTYTCRVDDQATGNKIAERSILLVVHLPLQVVNVQVFQYSPLITNVSKQNILVIWNNVTRIVSRYNITIIDYTNGNNLNLSQPMLEDKMSYSVLQEEGQDTFPDLPLVTGRMYGVEVTAVYDSETGPTSTRVDFTISTTAQRYPMQLLALEPSGMIYYGKNTDLNQELRVEPNAGPIVVDAIDRRAYWYERTLKQMVLQNLAPGSIYKPLFRISADKEVVSLTYDWIAKMLYITQINILNRKLELFRRQIYNLDREENVLSSLQFTVTQNATIYSEINPMTGIFYYSITEGVTTRMYHLNLTAAKSYRQIVPVNISIMSTPDFAINPRGNTLLLGDKISGNINQCSHNFTNCNIYINRDILVANSGRSHVGLPPHNIKYGGDFIYWSSGDPENPGLYAVNVSDLTMLIVVGSNSNPNFIVPLSPDQQPLPAIQCLAPDPVLLASRQIVRLEFATNTSLQFSWQDNPDSKANCESAQFSVAPFVFTLEFEDSSGLLFIQKTTRKRHILITDLRPSTKYYVRVNAVNQYSITRGFTYFTTSYQLYTEEIGSCTHYSNGSVLCTVVNTKLTLWEDIRSIEMKCGVYLVGPSVPNYKWIKDGVTVVKNGIFTRDFYRSNPIIQRISPTPIIASSSGSITLNLKPEANSNSEMHTLSCFHYRFQANLEDTLYYLAKGSWTCEVDSTYHRDTGSIIIDEPDLCSGKDQCGGFSCTTVAKRMCCNCPRSGNDIFSKDLGRLCTRNVCPPIAMTQHGTVNIFQNEDGLIVGTYSCSKGFNLVGQQNRTCQQSIQQWTGIAPLCEGSNTDAIHQSHFLQISLTSLVYTLLY